MENVEIEYLQIMNKVVRRCETREVSASGITKKDKLFRLLAYFSKLSAKSVLEKYQIVLENSWKCPGFFFLKMSGNPVHANIWHI